MKTVQFVSVDHNHVCGQRTRFAKACKREASTCRRASRHAVQSIIASLQVQQSSASSYTSLILRSMT